VGGVLCVGNGERPYNLYVVTFSFFLTSKLSCSCEHRVCV